MNVSLHEDFNEGISFNFPYDHLRPACQLYGLQYKFHKENIVSLLAKGRISVGEPMVYTTLFYNVMNYYNRNGMVFRRLKELSKGVL
jgi:hypothetical protein